MHKVITATYTVIETVSIAFDTLDNLRTIMISLLVIGSIVSIGIGYVLVGKLLFIARNDSGSVVFRKDHININKLVARNVKKYGLLGRERGIVFEGEYNSHHDLIGDEKLIDSVVSTLCDNSIKYNKPDGKVYVTVKDLTIRRKPYVEVTVKDTGIGIDEADINKVFERFHRQDTSRNKKIEGYGLGLSIAKVIVESHNGKIGLKSQIGEGTTFYFRIPCR